MYWITKGERDRPLTEAKNIVSETYDDAASAFLRVGFWHDQAIEAGCEVLQSANPVENDACERVGIEWVFGDNDGRVFVVAVRWPGGGREGKREGRDGIPHQLGAWHTRRRLVGQGL